LNLETAVDRVRRGNLPIASRGFTLIELVVTVAILGVLAMMAVPMLQVTAQRQKEAELRAGLREIRSAIDAYHQAWLDKKIEKIEAASGYPPDLDVLVKGIPDISQPGKRALYFLRRMPRDPFYPDAHAPAAETWGKRSYASPADDPSEGEDVFDVYSRSQKTGLNGVAYRAW
jgi:general secretion pathway protein G